MVQDEHDKSVAAAKKKLPPIAYSKMLSRLRLRDIALQDVKATLRSLELTKKGSYAFDESCHLLSKDKTSAHVAVEYDLKAKCGRRVITHIKARYIVAFETTGELSKEFFTLYNKYNLPLQTFPYFRELVHSSFTRMGLPPLVLPLRKFLLKDSK